MAAGGRRDGRWRAETAAILTGCTEWRLAHPRATLAAAAALAARGPAGRHRTTTPEQPVTLRRHRAGCPAGGVGLGIV